MFATEKYLNLLREFKRKYAAEYGITRIGIFGSVARGEQKKGSDVDVCIDAPPMGLLALSGLHLKLEDLFNAPVDVVRMRKEMSARFKQRVEKEAIYV
jgi:predicted nucleotidyltransferase